MRREVAADARTVGEMAHSSGRTAGRQWKRPGCLRGPAGLSARGV